MNGVLALVAASDDRFATRMRGWRPPRWFRLFMLWATRLGDGWGWIALFAVLLLGAHARREVLAGSLAAGLAGLAFVTLKRRFKRQRPCAGAPHPLYGVRASDCFSFPSGHSATSFAIATVLGLAFPAEAVLFLALAACVAVSRVALGLHYVSDVVAGSALGALIGALTYAALLG
jgi:undecaprenyl-diphosphatase